MREEATLILLRHGQSEWNKLNLFTGWVDIPLSKEGIEEAIEAGRKISHVPIDMIFMSSLIRSHMTAMLAMAEHKGGKVPSVMHSGEGKLQEWARVYGKGFEALCIPAVVAWELNERMYGKLQGLNKQETMDKYGKEQVHIWRRSYDVAPPEGESLAMTAARAIPYFEQHIMPYLKAGKNILVSAHGNSLRAIIMKLDNLSKEEVLNLELATGEPIFYTYQKGIWKRSA